MMMNARQEFIEATKGHEVLAAEVIDMRGVYRSGSVTHRLLLDHTPEELGRFLRSIDFDYDPGFGSQEVDGSIYAKDAIWYRREYDGSEHWRKINTAVPMRLYQLD